MSQQEQKAAPAPQRARTRAASTSSSSSSPPGYGSAWIQILGGLALAAFILGGYALWANVIEPKINPPVKENQAIEAPEPEQEPEEEEEEQKER